MPAEETFHEPMFIGSPDEAEALSDLPKSSGKTVDDIVDLVVQLKNPAAGTIKEYKGSLEKFRTHYGNDCVLGSNKEDVTAFRTHLLSRYKTSTAKKTIRYISGLWEVCVDEQWTGSNPWKGILKHVRDDTPKKRTAVPEAICAGVVALPRRNQALFWLIAYSGMQIQEALGLRGRDLDLKAGLIHIASHERRGLGNGIKNTNSIRSIPIDDRLMPWVKLVNTKEELVFPEFLSAAGNWNTPSFWQQQLKCSPHKVRHTIATQLREKDVNEQTIADLLGHSVQTVIGQYGQTTLKAIRRAIRFLEWP
jgi:integrase